MLPKRVPSALPQWTKYDASKESAWTTIADVAALEGVRLVEMRLDTTTAYVAAVEAGRGALTGYDCAEVIKKAAREVECLWSWPWRKVESVDHGTMTADSEKMKVRSNVALAFQTACSACHCAQWAQDLTATAKEAVTGTGGDGV